MTITETVEERIARVHEGTGIPIEILAAAIEAPTVRIESRLKSAGALDPDGYDSVRLSPDHHCTLGDYVALLGIELDVSTTPYGQVMGNYHYVYNTYAWVRLAHECGKPIEHWDAYDYAYILQAVYYPDGSARVFHAGRCGTLNNPKYAHTINLDPGQTAAGRLTLHDQLVFLCRTSCGRVAFQVEWTTPPGRRRYGIDLTYRLPRVQGAPAVNERGELDETVLDAAQQCLSVNLAGVTPELLWPASRYHPASPDKAYLCLIDGVELPEGAVTTSRIKEPGLVWLSARRYSQLGIPDAVTGMGLYRLSQRRRR
ncbi:hypothetical protein HY374_03225 [Candidatus Berkelbacteria bacterium]|nr:hypothetical protein [Candidatus Berkelbacteria bacterium]